jgi:hypothetical protein
MNSGILPTIAGIGMSFAGFAGLIAALRPAAGQWRPADIHMIQGTVMTGLAVVILALAPIPLGDIFPTQQMFRAAAVVLAAFFVLIAIRQSRSGRRVAATSDDRGRAFAVVAIPAIVVMPLAIYAGTLELYELALIVLLLIPVIVFSLVLGELGTVH